MIADVLPAVTRTGWPWSGSDIRPAGVRSEERSWPRISVITINLNHGAYLEAALRSVLLQGYPNLEYIVVDGGSTDSSIEILERYEPWLASWSSAKDRGTAEAINRGIARATGEIIGVALSSDCLLPGALEEVGLAWATRGPALLYGRCRAMSSDGDVLPDEIMSPRAAYRWEDLLNLSVLPFPSTFFPRRLGDEDLHFDERLQIANDWELCLRVARVYEAVFVDKYLAAFRLHEAQKSGASGSRRAVSERLHVLGRYMITRDVSVRERATVLNAIGFNLWMKSFVLKREGRRGAAGVALLASYALSWREWSKRARVVQRVLPRLHG